MRDNKARPVAGTTKARRTTRSGRANYTTTTGQKLADAACCFALFGAIPAIMAIVGVGL